MNIIKKNSDYKAVYNCNNSFSDYNIVIFVKKNNDIVNKYEHYAHLLNKTKITTINNEEKGSPIEQKIINCLKSEPVSIDYICEYSGIDIATLNSVLLIMEIKGIIAKHPGNRYSINEGRI